MSEIPLYRGRIPLDRPHTQTPKRTPESGKTNCSELAWSTDVKAVGVEEEKQPQTPNPTPGSGKTNCCELAMLRLFRTRPDAKVLIKCV